MRKTICFLLATFMFIMSGCSFTPASGSADKSKPDANVLADKGLELIAKVDKFAECKEYINFYSSDEEITKVISDIGDNDYTNPKGIFVIKDFDTVIFENMIPNTDLPEDVVKMVKHKLATAMPSQMAAWKGSATLAAVSILNYDDSFIYESLQSPVIYLYTYKNGYNFMINYNPNDENIVNARVTVVINDELSNCTSKEEVTDFFKYPLNLEGISVTMAMEEK